MSRQLHAALRWLSVLAATSLSLAQDPAPAPPVAVPFETILWVPAERAREAAHLAAVHQAGFSAINLGPEGDAGLLLASGLGFYLDQPIGKGFLELRDRDWEPLQRQYERTRDTGKLVRPQCLRNHQLLVELGARAAAAAAKLHAAAGPAMRFVAIADEASTTRHGNPLDVCRCERCLSAFREFAMQRYGSLAQLNEAWGTQFASIEALEPLSTDQVRRRELGGVVLPENLTPFAAWLDFVDEGFRAAVQHLCEQVRSSAPGVPCGLTGLQAPFAFGGHDYARLLPGLTLLEAYDLGGAVELARSLVPRAQHWSTLQIPTELEADSSSQLLALLAEAAARGQDGVVVWNDERVLAADETLTAAGKAMRTAFQSARPALDACAGAVPEHDSVWICESHASVRAWWMLDSANDGLTWVRRLASHEAAHSTSMAARRGWSKLLADVGIAPRFLGELELPARLLQDPPRLLVLPACIALSDRACIAIAAYVQQGGTVVADHTTALYDENLRRRASGGLDVLFGIEQRSLRWEDLGVREGKVRGGTLGAVDGSLRAQVAERSGSESVFIERRYRRGRAVYLNVPVCLYAGVRLEPTLVAAAADLRKRIRQVLASALIVPRCEVRGEGLPACVQRRFLRARDGRRLLAVRIDAIDAPPILRQLGQQGAREVHLMFPQSVRLVSLAGKELGSGTDIELPLDAFLGLFVEVR
jgi:hypothetical protein